MIFRSIPLDVMYICAELVTGKSLPVLVGITRLPIDQFLAWIMLSLGAVFGTLFSAYSMRHMLGMTLLGFANRLVQLSFSLCMSLSLLLSIAKSIHPERGVVLSLIPAFCIVVQSLPQRDSTALLAFILSCLLFYGSMVTAVMPETREHPGPRVLNEHSLSSQAVLVASHDKASPLAVSQILGRALQLFLLSFYACIQHAPTQVYFSSNPRLKNPATYASHHHAMHGHYTLYVGLLSAWIRVCVWSGVCFFQDNTMHYILENDRSRGPWDWLCCSAYMTTLLYSACWTATQLREQVLPRFGVESATGKLKLLACILAFAALFRQKDPQIMFTATNALTLLSLVTTLFTLKPPSHYHDRTGLDRFIPKK